MPTDLATVQNISRGIRGEVSEVENGFALRRGSHEYLITTEDAEQYLARKADIRRTIETQIYYPGYYEHIVRFEGNGLRSTPRSGDDSIVLNSPDGQTKIEIGIISNFFTLALLDVDRLSPQLRRFMMAGLMFSRPRADRPIGTLFRLISIRVITDATGQLGKSVARLHELAEAATFHIAYGQGTSVTFTKSWERTDYWIGRKEAEEVQFPRRIYNTELVGYYNLALASDSLVLGYLALYNILEYFYTSVAESAIHDKLKEQLVAPDFTHTKAKKLRDLIKTIRQFDSKLDEANSLKLVLSKHFEKADLRSWVRSYETKEGVYFTNETSIFGTNQRLDVSDGSIIGSLASRIYLIRNALVHNKEGEASRFIPYSGQEEFLSKEILILLFLAEQLIIKTGKDIV
ncbi:hypothetical protein [Hymenobacter rubidus]|uniref:hypothetical protein n=1 Tax=Hymenobacter rubidus TaxID=1441626 RepID=UPI00191D3BDA|nr:hypothetical protein [Hymenobacter rubidus]